MKVKRLLLIVVLIVFTAVCMYSMNSTFDRLARYQYVTDENRELIETYMSDDDINYMVQQQIKPEQFERFIELQGFTVRNTLYYDAFYKLTKQDPQYIVNFVNSYKKCFSFSEIENLLSHYTMSQLEEFYNGGYPYIENAELVVNPSEYGLTLADSQTFFTYVPKTLTTISQQIIPNLSKSNGALLQLRSEVLDPLSNMCSAAQKTNQKVCGGFVMSDGFVSYEEQVHAYDEALLIYGVENVHEHISYPGQNEGQTGFVLTLTLSEVSTFGEMIESEQLKWLKEHAKEYGFEIISIAKKEEDQRSLVKLRYVGMGQNEKVEKNESQDKVDKEAE